MVVVGILKSALAFTATFCFASIALAQDAAAEGGDSFLLHGFNKAWLAWVVVLLVVALGAVFLYSQLGGLDDNVKKPTPLPSSNEMVEFVSRAQVVVTSLSIGVAAHARPVMEAKMAALIRSNDLTTGEGLVARLQDLVTVLRDVRMSWLYANVVSNEGLRGKELDAQVASLVDLWTKRAHEEPSPRNSKAIGVSVLTIIVGARRALPPVNNPSDANSLEFLLNGFNNLPPEGCVALATNWTPVSETAELSRADLERRFPDMRKITELSVGLRVFCTYCDVPFAVGLHACPQCGAPLERTQLN